MKRLILRLATVILLLPLTWYCAGLLGAMLPGSVAGVPVAPASVRVGLLRGPIHYDFLLPLDAETRAAFAFAAARVPMGHRHAEWLLAGWGSEAFYTTAGTYADITAGAVWQAISGDEAVMRLDVLGALPADAPGLVWLDLTATQHARLRDGILASFARDSAGGPQPHPAPGHTASDGFWRATGHFDAMRSCNVWVGQRLRAAGVPFGLWTPTPQAVELALWRFERP